MSIQESIRVGDQFKTALGLVWVVTRTLPGGVCELSSQDRTLSSSKYTRDIRRMTRLEGRDAKAVRIAQLLSAR